MNPAGEDLSTSTRLVILDAGEFARGAAGVIIAEIATALQRSRSKRVSLMLAGGSTPREIYREIAAVSGLPWNAIDVWFGDERAVPTDHADSNYAMARATLLEPAGVPHTAVHRMEAERSDLTRAADEYAAALPDSIAILILGIGTDGHTASLFPSSPLLAILDRNVDIAHAPLAPHTRMTILPRVIRRAATRIVLAAGTSKAGPVARALDESTSVESCPAALARDGIWVLDHDAASKLQ